MLTKLTSEGEMYVFAIFLPCLRWFLCIKVMPIGELTCSTHQNSQIFFGNYLITLLHILSRWYGLNLVSTSATQSSGTDLACAPPLGRIQLGGSCTKIYWRFVL